MYEHMGWWRSIVHDFTVLYGYVYMWKIRNENHNIREIIYTCYSCYDERQNTVSVCFIFFVYFKSKWVKCFLRRLDEPCGCNFSKKKKSLQFVGHLFEMICCTFRCRHMHLWVIWKLVNFQNLSSSHKMWKCCTFFGLAIKSKFIANRMTATHSILLSSGH